MNRFCLARGLQERLANRIGVAGNNGLIDGFA
jgi:hypothetical protein